MEIVVKTFRLKRNSVGCYQNLQTEEKIVKVVLQTEQKTIAIVVKTFRLKRNSVGCYQNLQTEEKIVKVVIITFRLNRKQWRL